MTPAEPLASNIKASPEAAEAAAAAVAAGGDGEMARGIVGMAGHCRGMAAIPEEQEAADDDGGGGRKGKVGGDVCSGQGLGGGVCVGAESVQGRQEGVKGRKAPATPTNFTAPEDGDSDDGELSMKDIGDELKRFRAEAKRPTAATRACQSTGQGDRVKPTVRKGYYEPKKNKRLPAVVAGRKDTPGRGWEGLDVWAAGLNNYGQLGLGHDREVCGLSGDEDAGEECERSEGAGRGVEGCKLNFGRGVAAEKALVSVKMVACGETHSVAVVHAKDGGDLVISVGCDDCGQLGRGGQGDSSSWGEVSYCAGWAGRGGLPKGLRVVAIGCGQNHSLVILQNDDVVGWGDNTNGQLGLPAPPSSSFLASDSSPPPVSCASVEFVSVPTKISGFSGRAAAAVGAGAGHSLLLTQDGLVWAVGLNSRGQLGLSLSDHSTHTPRVLSWRPAGGGREAGGKEENDLRVVKVVCGSYHSLFLSGDGGIHACGDNGRGQCGLGPLSHQTTPTAVRLPGLKVGECGSRVIQVACGRRHSMALTEEHQVFACGDNSQGQVRSCVLVCFCFSLSRSFPSLPPSSK